MIKLRIRDINPHIVCSLCAGYFIEATTITECLHTFCKSCIVRFLQTSKCCPQCGLKVHETQPLLNLKPDRVLQDIIFKLVPGLYENESKRMDEYYGDHAVNDGGVGSSMITINNYNCFCNENNMDPLNPKAHYYYNDKIICFSLNFCRNLEDLNWSLDVEQRLNKTLKGKFLRCSERACVIHVKRLILKVLYSNYSSEDGNEDMISIMIMMNNNNNNNKDEDDDDGDRFYNPDDDWTTLKQLMYMRGPPFDSLPIPLYFKIDGKLNNVKS